MRSADKITLLRIGIVLLILYLVLMRFNPLVSIVLFAIAFLLDGADGYFALREAGKGKVSPSMYLNYSLGDKKYSKEIKALKEDIEKTAKYGPRFDVAADRITEYSFWALFSFLGIVPLFVFIIIIIRHSVADAMLGIKGTSSKMTTSVARRLYASSISRGGINVVKFITFSYLILVYVSGYPSAIGYALTAILVIYIMARGIAEVYESLKS